jgi:hypothetical protein
MTIGISIKYHSLEAKKQVWTIPSTWPYLQAGCSDAVLNEKIIIQSNFRYFGFSCRFRRRGARCWFSPQAGSAQKQFDETRVVALYKPDDLHLSATGGALKGINLIHTLYKGSPSEPALQLIFCKGFRVIYGSLFWSLFCFGLPHAALFIRVPAIVTYLMVSLVWDMLGY